jgi:dolichyl-phosphate-mannose--protein O-mannosyl transferase
VPDEVRRRLAPQRPAGHWSWAGTLGVVAIGGLLRLLNLGHPKGMIFDEIYYAQEAKGLLAHGVEWDLEQNTAKYVVHPPLGKWLIAIGELLFRYHETGWRFAAAVAGTVAVLLLTRIAIRMFRSTVLGCTAGLLMALDGMHLVLSRAALLDIFLSLFVLAAFGCVMLDRDQRRRRLLEALQRGFDPTGPGGLSGARLGVPWWRFGAGVSIGCACSVKWSGLWYLILLIGLVFAFEVGLRRAAGAPRPWLGALRQESGWIVFAFVTLPLGTYLASWTGWFITDNGYNRHWLASQGQQELPVIGALQNLWHYHVQAYNFHTTLAAPHRYQSWPWQWLLLGRPVAFYWSGDGPCASDQCAAEVLLLGTPVLWWSFLPALAVLAWHGISRRDWRAATIGVSVAAGILPWFQYELDNRTMFFFYALPAEPFLILAVVYALGVIIGPRPSEVVDSGRWLSPSDRRMVGSVIAGLYVLAVAWCFAYFYPVYTAETITEAQWWARMWLGNRWV